MGIIPGRIAVRDRDAAIEFYQRLLGTPPTMLPNDEEAAWQLTGGGWLYVLRDADRAGRAVATLLVDDLDERLAAAAERGIELGPVETKAVTVRTTWITDPDGNRIQIGQPGYGPAPPRTTAAGSPPLYVGASLSRQGQSPVPTVRVSEVESP